MGICVSKACYQWIGSEPLLLGTICTHNTFLSLNSEDIG